MFSARPCVTPRPALSTALQNRPCCKWRHGRVSCRATAPLPAPSVKNRTWPPGLSTFTRRYNSRPRQNVARRGHVCICRIPVAAQLRAARSGAGRGPAAHYHPPPSATCDHGGHDLLSRDSTSPASRAHGPFCSRGVIVKSAEKQSSTPWAPAHPLQKKKMRVFRALGTRPWATRECRSHSPLGKHLLATFSTGLCVFLAESPGWRAGSFRGRHAC